MDKVRKNTLMQTYYRAFIALNVVPLLLVFIGTEIIIGFRIKTAAIANIDTFQEGICNVVSNDVLTNSLQLSHFVHVNNSEFMETAVRVHNTTGADHYDARQKLDKAFRTAMSPSHHILVGGVYMKDSGSVYVKDEIILPESQIREEEWYLRALERPNQVVIGGYDNNRVQMVYGTQRGKQFVIVTAMATDHFTDKSGEIEVVTFFTVSNLSNVLNSRLNQNPGEYSVILDRDGHVLYGDMGNKEIYDFFNARAKEFTTGTKVIKTDLLSPAPQNCLFRTRAIPDTEWSVVTFCLKDSLVREFYHIGAMVALVILALLSCFFIYTHYFLRSIITPVQTVCEGMARLDRNDLSVQIVPQGQREIQDLMISFNQMVQSIRNMLDYAEKTEKVKHRAEIQALQSQINPHFIVNTLNSIRFMAEVAKYEGIRKMAEALISIVSCSFRSNISFYTVREELEMVNTYVYIMRIRYSNSFTVDYQADPDCLDYKIPRLTLQPVVENSITHGFDELDEELGHILIRISKDDHDLMLSVEDNGSGISPEQAETILNGHSRRHDDNTSIGLENILARIRLNFGADAGIEIESKQGQYTRIIVKLPLDRLEKQEGRHDTDTDC